MRHLLPVVVAAVVLASPSRVWGAPQDAIDAAFGLQEQGATLADVRAALEPHRGDDAVDFAIGAVDFLVAGERLVQRAHRHGFLMPFRTVVAMTGGRANFIAWFANNQPEATTPRDLDAAVLEWIGSLAEADESLAAVDGAEFTCVIDVPAVRFDINADGRTTAAESIRTLFGFFPPRSVWNPDTNRTETGPLVPTDLVIAFDRGDVEWPRGYCRLLMAVGNLILAHDYADLFDHTGHVFFPKAEIKYDFLPGSTWSLERLMGGMQTPTPFDVTDLIAFVGNMRLPVDDADRTRDAHGHLQACVAHGKAMWSHYDRERDDDREWIPNPRQTAAFHEVRVDAATRDAWLVFLDEAEAILDGRKVLRFWRGDGTRGIDVPKVFLEPREFDLLYWVQGSAAAPYLSEGEFTTPGTWAQLQQVFNRRVFRYSFWFN